MEPDNEIRLFKQFGLNFRLYIRKIGFIRPKKVRQPKPKMANVMGVGIIGNGLKRIKIETPEEISKRENLNETIAIFVSKQLRGDEKSGKNFDRLNTVAGLLKGGL